ncbi:hypothetical protein CN360_11570 [Bacillus cereus]|uniref:hypothetical protein n=1 Tax=Bacillus cereus TaxID=1396 RepID=UPI000BEC5907|nr:hypothetical protein [Bacillus cereus]PEC03201.1 hypothetical protein COM98_20200 [Bacillus cereus]PEV76420.1 hypothetical protein CN437_21910 [Bacillus cereus]PEY93537.1 hypothetical protein CN360_11570 [Bacillus cereus]PGE42719.1 hypothetical protein COM63_27030 [Bacillus cereus]
MREEFTLRNDIILVAYFINKNNWSSASKTSFQRILYFAAVLSPVFIPEEKWVYDFSNTIFGPYNNDISKKIQELLAKELLELEERQFFTNRIEERFRISDKGIVICESTFFRIKDLHSKIEWFDIIIKTLSIYGEEFLSKLIKTDPNVVSQNMINSYKKISINDSEENVSKEFFNYIKEKGKEKLTLETKEDKEFLLVFFDILYRKYKGERRI